jgi:hypothetical protein
MTNENIGICHTCRNEVPINIAFVELRTYMGTQHCPHCDLPRLVLKGINPGAVMGELEPPQENDHRPRYSSGAVQFTGRLIKDKERG